MQLGVTRAHDNLIEARTANGFAVQLSPTTDMYSP